MLRAVSELVEESFNGRDHEVVSRFVRVQFMGLHITVPSRDPYHEAHLKLQGMLRTDSIMGPEGIAMLPHEIWLFGVPEATAETRVCKSLLPEAHIARERFVRMAREAGNTELCQLVAMMNKRKKLMIDIDEHFVL
jgi:hypothetical protein